MAQILSRGYWLNQILSWGGLDTSGLDPKLMALAQILLEERIRDAPRAIVAPLVANIPLSGDDAFDENKMDCYTFEVIGGNHSQTVLQKLIEEPMMRLEASLQHRLAIVYKNLTNEEAISIGKMHNLTGETHLCTKFQDDVKIIFNDGRGEGR